jgi:hypothetical protein
MDVQFPQAASLQGAESCDRKVTKNPQAADLHGEESPLMFPNPLPHNWSFEPSFNVL